jgi:NAD(P)-dependent dehydrogenase (short-subunit alcohol dehydrogenase family)
VEPRAEGPVVLVIGGVRGLGLAVARRLRRDGARVHVVWRSSGREARALEPEFPGRVHRADALEAADLEALVARVVERDGRLDSLVHAVGEYVTGTLEELEPADLRRMLASNVESAFLALRAARAPLRASRGAALVFACAGLHGLHAWRRTAAYAAAKSALLVLARSLAAEEARHGVRINVISPGHIPHAHAAPDTLDPELWKRIPMGVPGTPEDVAGAAAWLLSDAAGYVTGANLEVAGGWNL